MPENVLRLPAPEKESLLDMLHLRKSVRHYTAESLTLAQLSTLLFAAGGRILDASGRARRTAPSAGSCYPVDIRVFAGRVQDLPAGVYFFRPDLHALKLCQPGDISSPLMHACLSQPWVRDAAAVFILTGAADRIRPRYGGRSEQYMFLEAGHIAQNAHLQATSMGLGMVPVGAFIEEELSRLLCIDEQQEKLLYVLAFGRPSPDRTL